MADQERNEETRINENLDSTCVGETLRPQSVISEGKVLSDFTLTDQDTLGSATALNASADSVNITPIDDEDCSGRLDLSSQASAGALPAMRGVSIEEVRLENRSFELEEEIGRGGMGVVYKARQKNLNRQVAIKTLLSKNPDPVEKQRFVSEAEVTGFLDHPNIVPIHDLGLSQTGQPLLAMKLVGGRPWSELLKPQGEGGAVEKSLNEHLEILLNVSNAIAFAHSKFIAHCDLKPSNVMVGDFGEVLVMDWGIAIDFREPTERSLLEIRALPREGVSSPCGTPSYMAPELAEGKGELIGPWTDVFLLGALLCEILTREPLYQGRNIGMALILASKCKPPELPKDAPAELKEICLKALAKVPEDRYRDVESFQQALRAYLSHRESLQISDRASTLREACQQRISQGVQLADRERVQLYADYAEVVAAYKQALLLWQGNVGALTGELEARIEFAATAIRFHDLGLAGAQLANVAETNERAQELHKQIRELKTQRVRQKNALRRLKQTFFTAVTVVLAMVSIGFYFVNAEKNKVTAKNEEIERQKEEANVQRNIAKSEAKRAESRFKIADRALKKLVYEVREELAPLPWRETKDVRRRLLEVARNGRIELAQGYREEKNVGREYAVTLLELASIWRTEARLPDALKALEEALVIFRRIAKTDSSNIVAQRDVSESLDGIGDVKRNQGDLLGALESYRQSLAIRVKLAKAFPGHTIVQRDLMFSLDRIGDVKESQGDLGEALNKYQECLAIARELARADPSNVEIQRDLAIAFSGIGDVKKRLGDLAGAFKSYEQSLAIDIKLAKSAPSNARNQEDLCVSLTRLGDVTKGQGNLAGALRFYQQSLAVRSKLAQADRSNAGAQNDWAVALAKIGFVKESLGDFASALQSFEQCLKIARALAEADPSDAQGQLNLSISLSRIGLIKKKQGLLKSALRYYQECLVILRNLAKRDPSNVSSQQVLSNSLEKIGEVKKSQGDLNAALIHFRECLVIRSNCVKANPSNPQFQRSLSIIQERIGSVKLRQGDLAAALKSYQQCFIIFRDLANRDPSNAEAQRSLSISLENIGDVKTRQGDLKAALTMYQQSLGIRSKLAVKNPSNPQMQRDLSASLETIGNINQSQDDLAGALRYYQQSLTIRSKLAKAYPSNAQAQRDLSISLERTGDVKKSQGNLSGALEDYQSCLEIVRVLAKTDPSNVQTQRDLSVSLEKVGDAYKSLRNFDKAIQNYQESLAVNRRWAKADPSNAQAQRDLSVSLFRVANLSKEMGRLKEAVQYLQWAVENLQKLSERVESKRMKRELAYLKSLLEKWKKELVGPKN